MCQRCLTGHDVQFAVFLLLDGEELEQICLMCLMVGVGLPFHLDSALWDDLGVVSEVLGVELAVACIDANVFKEADLAKGT